LHRQREGDPFLFRQGDAAQLIGKSLVEHPDHALADRRKLIKDVEVARRKHLAYDLGEHSVGISAVGVAVLDAYGRPIAISIPAPTHRFVEQRQMLSEAALKFREKLKSVVGR
jgi:DNA-binding IclR family transcriptional regulator